MTDAAWSMAGCAPGAIAGPGELDRLDWIGAEVPGTVAGALAAGAELDVDGRDWWYRARLDVAPPAAGEEVVLRLDGLATRAEVYVDGALLLQSASMWERHELALPRGAREIAIRFLALAPLLRTPRRPRARWRTRLAASGLRFERTTLLGRAPGFAPGPAVAGPWRPVTVERRRMPVVDALRLRPRLEGDDGVLAVRAAVRGATAPVTVAIGDAEAELHEGHAELRIPGVARWWPHTHGDPVLHPVALRCGGAELARRRVGFRALSWAERPEEDGLALAVNGVGLFARGAVWTPGPLRTGLEAARDAGLNLIRLAGTGIYESEAFHDLCDELGLLVWQDFMFANFDYPIADDAFRATVEREAHQVLERVLGRPSTAVLCGNSEVEQQVAMLGLDPALGRGELFGELLPGLAAEAGADVPYLPSAPCGGTLPMRTDRGVANYFGVGGYRRPLADARSAEVRFASECLAFANVGVEDDPAGVPRDVGADWDFADVRDHYLGLLYGLDAGELRATDPERYLDLSRAVTGEAMCEVLGEWRRAGSPCAGAIVLWLRDLLPGSGWGLLDHRGRPKVAWHHLRRALAPIAVWTVDEGLNGIAIHVANDPPAPLEARLHVALYRDGELLVDEAQRDVTVPGHGLLEVGVEELLERFADAGYAYRFGPPAHDSVVVTLEREGAVISQAVRFPAGHPTTPLTAADLGLAAQAAHGADDTVGVRLTTRRLAWGVRVLADGLAPDDDGFVLAPGAERTVTLTPTGDGPSGPISVRALNLAGSIAP
ncbi:MAG: glycosyl hydrolase 2 galactose-binding domain-containing protein [Solirubrobacteraceae bacterium]